MRCRRDATWPAGTRFRTYSLLLAGRLGLTEVFTVSATEQQQQRIQRAARSGTIAQKLNCPSLASRAASVAVPPCHSTRFPRRGGSRELVVRQAEDLAAFSFGPSSASGLRSRDCCTGFTRPAAESAPQQAARAVAPFEGTARYTMNC